MESKALPIPPDRRRHGERLEYELRQASTRADRRRQELPPEADAANGIYVTFEAFPGVGLALETLDPRQGRIHPELITVQEIEVDGAVREVAVVYVPDGKLGFFLKRLRAYAETAGEDKGRNRNFVDRVEAIGLASIEQLWTDAPSAFPLTEDRVWWELWLRRRAGREVEEVKRFAALVGAALQETTLAFQDRTVVLIEATATELASALDVLNDLAELRSPHLPAPLFARQPPTQQAEAVERLAARTRPAPLDAPVATILDTGVHRAHPLIEPSLRSEDCHTVDPAWGTADGEGHGTEMAGLALYGDLGGAIIAAGGIELDHALESVKILPPPPGVNAPELYGAITATAASAVEIEAPQRRRVFAQAITASWPDVGDPTLVRFGEPTSWSAAIDALAAGLGVDVAEEGLVFLNEDEVGAQRLFLISAGNTSTDEIDHLARSDLEPVEDPAQAWNAVTIGAYTELHDLSADQAFDGWTPTAEAGELSPFSRTSVAFQSQWPRKPEVVLEGGNTATSPDQREFDTPEILQLLTTKAPLGDTRLLTVANATSAATAEAAYLAASILSDNPSLWPETVRGLIVHSAQWTPAMWERFDGARSRRDRVALQRRYGMGVPDFARATRSATDALTLLVEQVIHPYDGEGRTLEMHLYDLPWPTEELAALGDVQVRMRVTLSYFIEPNPARRGWIRRYTYPSHGLRFDVRRPVETTDEFRKRVNEQARAEDERFRSSESDAQEWFFGPDQRTSGSLHTDLWEGTAADLADRGMIGIFPVTGWWKDRRDRDHSARGARYALIVSIETDEVDVDLWTPVAQAVGIPIEI
jgi:hypothetical protein